MDEHHEVIVETNWIVDVALQQDEVSVELFQHARAGRVRLFLPTFCLAEATKNVEARQSELRRVLKDQIPRLSRELARSPVTREACEALEQSIVGLSSAHDAMTAAFWLALRDIVATVTPLPPRADTIDLTAAIHDSLKLSPADSSVLASAVLACRERVCRTFMSKDDDFAQDGVKEYMSAEGLEFLSSAHPIVGPLRQ